MDKTRPVFSPRGCVACWKCVDACPKNTIGKVCFLWHRHAKPHFNNCIGCMKCVAVCPENCFRRPD